MRTKTYLNGIRWSEIISLRISSGIEDRNITVSRKKDAENICVVILFEDEVDANF